ncbi:penicillin-binding protein [Spirochaetia bacterium]|nr:penicillin-binding protein [Spirochaetia bacterium]GHU34000.1 penicillin-binding protein [Spirochaetia bacterium]
MPPTYGRFRFFAYGLIAAGVILLCWYAGLMLFPEKAPDVLPPGGTPSNERSGTEQPRETLSTADRGPIVDRNGRVLALQEPYINLGVNPKDFRNYPNRTARIAEKLSPLLDIPVEELKAVMTHPTLSFVYLKKGVDRETMAEFYKAAEKDETNELLSFISREEIKSRRYPEESLASQIIGFVNKNYRGGEGIESSLNSLLAPGGDNRGNRVVLTIDINVQRILERFSAQILEQHKAQSVMFMAMDPATGDILGAASLPGFEPSNFQNYDPSTWLFRPVVDAYEPGSVFKIFSMAAVMQSGAADDNSFFTCNGQYVRTGSRGERIVIKCLGNHGRVGIRDIIRLSCNAGAAYASDLLESQDFYNTLSNFGFGLPTFVGNPGESPGLFQVPSRWSNRTKPTIAIGQEISVSAMQMLQASTAVAGNGQLVPLRIIKDVLAPDGSQVKLPPETDAEKIRRENREKNPPISPEVARLMRQYMLSTTTSGTGWRAFLDDVSTAVKTGTAQLYDPATKTYSTTDFIASCMAILPVDNPALVLYLVITRPLGYSFFGGQIAAPFVREAANELVNYLGIPRGRNPQLIHPGIINVQRLVNAPIPQGFVPDYTGYSKQQLIPLVQSDEIRVQIVGNGWVRRQNLIPGSVFSPSDLLLLELN